MRKTRHKAIIIFGLIELVKGALGSFYFFLLIIGIFILKAKGQYSGLQTIWGDIVWLFAPGPLIFLSSIGIFALKDYARKFNIFINALCSLLLLSGTAIGAITCFTDRGNYSLSKTLLLSGMPLVLFIPSVIAFTRPRVKECFR
jgi:hypothetical protein